MLSSASASLSVVSAKVSHAPVAALATLVRRIGREAARKHAPSITTRLSASNSATTGSADDKFLKAGSCSPAAHLGVVENLHDKGRGEGLVRNPTRGRGRHEGEARHFQRRHYSWGRLWSRWGSGDDPQPDKSTLSGGGTVIDNLRSSFSNHSAAPDRAPQVATAEPPVDNPSTSTLEEDGKSGAPGVPASEKVSSWWSGQEPAVEPKNGRAESLGFRHDQDANTTSPSEADDNAASTMNDANPAAPPPNGQQFVRSKSTPESFTVEGAARGSAGAPPPGGDASSFSPPSADYLYYHRLQEQLHELHEKTRNLPRFAFMGIAGGLGLLCSILYMRWTWVVGAVSDETSKVVKEVVASAELKDEASIFSKDLLHKLMTDEEISRVSGKWVLELIAFFESELGKQIASLLKQDVILEELTRLGMVWIQRLCEKPEIREALADLVIQVLLLPRILDQTVHLTRDIVKSEAVMTATAEALYDIVTTEEAINRVSTLGRRATKELLEDEFLKRELVTALSETLRRDEVQRSGRAALWGIMMPGFLSREGEKGSLAQMLGSAEAHWESLPEAEKENILRECNRLISSKKKTDERMTVDQYQKVEIPMPELVNPTVRTSPMVPSVPSALAVEEKSSFVAKGKAFSSSSPTIALRDNSPIPPDEPTTDVVVVTSTDQHLPEASSSNEVSEVKPADHKIHDAQRAVTRLAEKEEASAVPSIEEQGRPHPAATLDQEHGLLSTPTSPPSTGVTEEKPEVAAAGSWSSSTSVDDVATATQPLADASGPAADVKAHRISEKGFLEDVDHVLSVSVGEVTLHAGKADLKATALDGASRSSSNNEDAYDEPEKATASRVATAQPLSVHDGVDDGKTKSEISNKQEEASRPAPDSPAASSSSSSSPLAFIASTLGESEILQSLAAATKADFDPLAAMAPHQLLDGTSAFSEAATAKTSQQVNDVIESSRGSPGTCTSASAEHRKAFEVSDEVKDDCKTQADPQIVTGVAGEIAKDVEAAAIRRGRRDEDDGDKKKNVPVILDVDDKNAQELQRPAASMKSTTPAAREAEETASGDVEVTKVLDETTSSAINAASKSRREIKSPAGGSVADLRALDAPTPASSSSSRRPDSDESETDYTKKSAGADEEGEAHKKGRLLVAAATMLKHEIGDFWRRHKDDMVFLHRDEQVKEEEDSAQNKGEKNTSSSAGEEASDADDRRFRLMERLDGVHHESLMDVI
ncbi:unnamed protein product [Amoebophrya sp. A25]|nr:unnamed protein product [Amoebophrya sp. A25]|eukprot:GSA25T00005311001.1